jgi:hypothetical protein
MKRNCYVCLNGKRWSTALQRFSVLKPIPPMTREEAEALFLRHYGLMVGAFILEVIK